MGVLDFFRKKAVVQPVEYAKDISNSSIAYYIAKTLNLERARDYLISSGAKIVEIKNNFIPNLFLSVRYELDTLYGGQKELFTLARYNNVTGTPQQVKESEVKYNRLPLEHKYYYDDFSGYCSTHSLSYDFANIAQNGIENDPQILDKINNMPGKFLDLCHESEEVTRQHYNSLLEEVYKQKAKERELNPEPTAEEKLRLKQEAEEQKRLKIEAEYNKNIENIISIKAQDQSQEENNSVVSEENVDASQDNSQM